MKIAIVNLTKSLHDNDILPVINAINKQIKDDFTPVWNVWGRLSLVAPTKTNDPEIQGIIYLAENSSDPNVLGYHDMNFAGMPYGYVFTDLAKQLGEHWSVTLSHETLELLGDVNVNIFAKAKHPSKNYDVFYWVEACDAVESSTYFIDFIEVSDFVIRDPYFTPNAEPNKKNAFKASVKSFGMAPGGYMGFWDPVIGNNDTVFADTRAEERFNIKKKFQTRLNIR